MTTGAARPNMLLIVSDQQQWQTICDRSPARTPNINRLASQGIRFERPYATVALCCPSRAALLSGQYPWHNGILNQVHVPERTRADMFPGVQTYSGRLREAGYRLGYVGKWHVSWERTPLDFGFHDLRAPSGCNPVALTRIGMAEEPAPVRRELDVECQVTWPGDAPRLFFGIDHTPEDQTRPYIETSGVSGND